MTSIFENQEIVAIIQPEILEMLGIKYIQNDATNLFTDVFFSVDFKLHKYFRAH